MTATGVGGSRKKRKRKSNSAGIWRGTMGLIVVVTILVMGGFGLYAISKTDAFARIAGQQFRSVKPVYATGGSSVVDYEVGFRVRVKDFAGRGSVTLFCTCERSPELMAYRMNKIKMKISEGLSIGKSQTIEIDSDGAEVSSFMESERLTRSEAPPELVEMMELIGRPVASQSMTAEGAGKLTATDSGQAALELVNTIAFVQPPFAENVDWWDAPRVWMTEGGGQLKGDLRYEKKTSEGDRVTVSVDGSLRATNVIELNGMKLSGGILEVSGEQVYSKSIQQWVSGKLDLYLDGNGRLEGRSGRLDLNIDVSFDATTNLSSGQSSLPAGDPAIDALNGQQDSTLSKGEFRPESSGMSGRGSEEILTRFDPSDAEWALPVPSPKRPVFASSFKPARKKMGSGGPSEMLRKMADETKSEGDYEKAAMTYGMAIKADSTNAMAIYQLACCQALWGKSDLAMKSFRRAIETGFDDYPTALTDSELGAVRETAEFPSQLRMIRQRYMQSSSTKVGTPLVTVPTGQPPARGWPVIFLLHGYGDTNESYVDLGEVWSEMGFVAVALPGSIPQSSGGFIWSVDSSEATHRQIQTALDALPPSAKVDRQQVSTMGFSQGALHSFQVARNHPEKYRGVIAMSPGGSPIEFGTWDLRQSGSNNQHMNVWFTHGRQEPLAPVIKLLEEICDAKGWQRRTTLHSEGHTFPENISELLPQMAAFVQQ